MPRITLGIERRSNRKGCRLLNVFCRHTNMLIHGTTKEYFNARRVERTLMFADSQATHKYLLKGICPICSQIIDYEDRIEIDHAIPLKEGGKHRGSNMRLLHWGWHRLVVHGSKRDQGSEHSPKRTKCSSLVRREAHAGLRVGENLQGSTYHHHSFQQKVKDPK